MPSQSPPSAAGGFLIAIGAVIGVAIGLFLGQVTPGFLIGTTIGIALAVIIWLRNRR